MDQIKQALPGRYVVIFEDVIILVPTDYANSIRQETNIYEPPQVAVLTSNAYAHCLPAFAYWFNKYWGSSITVMRYDTRPPALPKNFSTFAIGKQDHYTWSSGLRRAVEYWRYDLIILLLEDYWLQACDVGRSSKFLRYMQDQPAIAKIDLTDDRGKYPHRAWENDATMLISDDDAPFQTSLQAAIWRKSFLLSCLANNEDAWTFEKHGTKRLIERRKRGYNGIILGAFSPPLTYCNAVGGEGNKPGQWDHKKIPAWQWQEVKAKQVVQD